MVRWLSAGSCLLFVGCASLIDRNSQELVLFNPVLDAATLEVSVVATGCTEAADFYLRVVDDAIELRRIRRDSCAQPASLLRLAFSYDFSGDVYYFSNPVRFLDRRESR